MSSINERTQKWFNMIGHPTNYDYKHHLQLIRKFKTYEFTGEVYEQANGPNTVQKTLLMLPKTVNKKLPAVIVPFYYPDLVAGHDLDTLESTGKANTALALHLVRRGYVTISAEAYHLTYRDLDLDRCDFSRWQHSAEALLHDHPEWTGIGKLIADTQLLVDLLCSDSRIDHKRIAIVGHSLGGKIALYTGCLDDRISAILGSDFGLEWDRTNWSDLWYWGDKLNALKTANMNHADLLRVGGLKPFVLIAGLYDNEDALNIIHEAGYSDPSQYLFIHHATGHRPPMEALEKGYDFLQKCF